MSEQFKKFFYYMQLPEFDVAADAATTFKVVFCIYSLHLSLSLQCHALLVYGLAFELTYHSNFWDIIILGFLNVTLFDFPFHFSQISIVYDSFNATLIIIYTLPFCFRMCLAFSIFIDITSKNKRNALQVKNTLIDHIDSV